MDYLGVTNLKLRPPGWPWCTLAKWLLRMETLGKWVPRSWGRPCWAYRWLSCQSNEEEGKNRTAIRRCGWLVHKVWPWSHLHYHSESLAVNEMSEMIWGFFSSKTCVIINPSLLPRKRLEHVSWGWQISSVELTWEKWCMYPSLFYGEEDPGSESPSVLRWFS